MKCFIITVLIGVSAGSTAHAQTAAAPAKARLASEQNPFATGAKPAVSSSSSTHGPLASDSPALSAKGSAQPATSPAGQPAGSPASATPPSLDALPSNRGLH